MSFNDALSKLKSASVTVSGQDVDDDFYSLVVKLSQGAVLRSDYWRIIKNGRYRLSSFDHNQKYGLPAPINALAEAKKELEGKVISDVKFEKETGDLTFEFSSDLKLQVLNFTGYEVWEISFSDGSREFSNYAREYE